MTERVREFWRLAQTCMREQRLPGRLQVLLDNAGVTAHTRIANWAPVDRWISRQSRRLTMLHNRTRPAASGWQVEAPCPLALYDGAAAQVGHLLYVIGGYRSLGAVNDRIQVFDMGARTWLHEIAAPETLAHSHVAVASDGTRFVYAAAGQFGAQCRPAVRSCFAFDSRNGRWSALPPLPEPRYAGTMQLLDGRLHYVGGALADRFTPSTDHWSIAVSNGTATEASWRIDPPVPLGAMHRGSAVLDGAMYVFGGQQGDFIAIEGDPECTCNGRTPEEYFPDVYRYDSSRSTWSRCADMLIAVSHTDFSIIVANGVFHVIAGQCYKDPTTFRLRLTDAVQSYDPAADRWSITASFPYRIKVPMCGVHERRLYCTTGQRDTGSTNDAPGAVISDTWSVALDSLRSTARVAASASAFPALRGKSVLLVSHDLSMTGAPLLLIELATAMRDSGAIVRMTSIADEPCYDNPAERRGIALVPFENCMRWGLNADLVIANTAVAAPWIREFRSSHPQSANRVVWWLHENAPDGFDQYLDGMTEVGHAVFDSHDALRAWQEEKRVRFTHCDAIHPGNRTEISADANADRLPLTINDASTIVDRSQARARLRLDNDDFVLLSVAAVATHKGQDLIMRAVGDALERNPALPLRLIVIGFDDNTHAAQFLQRCTRSERRAILDGRLLFAKRPELSVFYRLADAFVMNSQGRGETFGRVSIEAMAFGLPVLGTNGGGTTEIVVDNETGLLHPIGTEGVSQLAMHIERLALDRQLARRLGAAGRARASEHFSAERFHRDFARVVDRVLNQPGFAGLR